MDALNRNRNMKHAVKVGNLEMVIHLLESGVSPNLRVNDDAGSLLHHTNNAEIASLLLDKGANIEARNRYRFTPLFRAVSKNNIDLVRVLLLNGASTSAVDMKEYTVLHHAVEICYCNYDIVTLLLEHGSSVTAVDKLHRTPLHVAFTNKQLNWDVVEVLIENGADLSALDRLGFTPLDVAIRSESCKSWMIKHLISIGAYVVKFRSGPDHCSVLYNFVKNKFDAEVIEIFIRKFGANPLSLGIHGENPLQKGLYSIDVVKKLIVFTTGWSIDNLDFPHEHIPSGIVYSLRSGCYVNISNNAGDTPLLILLNTQYWTNINLIKELLEHGADAFASNYRGDTPYKQILRIFQSICSNLSDLHINKGFSSSVTLRHILLNYKYIVTEIIKLFIKYSLLKPDTNVDNFEMKNHDENCSIDTFIQDCQVELNQIEKNYCISPYEFIDISRTECNHLIADVATKILDLYICGNYPIYRDIVITKLKRPLLYKKLYEELKHSKSHENNLPFIKLDNECLDYLTSYLCDRDLLNLIIAFKCSQKRCKLSSSSERTRQLENKIYELRKKFCPRLRKIPDEPYFPPVVNESVRNRNMTCKCQPLRKFDRNIQEFAPIYTDNSFARMLTPKTYFYDMITKGYEISVIDASLLKLMKSGPCSISEIMSLIDRGANIYIRDEHFNNLLHLAIQSNSTIEVINFLLNCDKNMIEMNCFGDNPLHDVLRSYNCNIDILKIILKHCSKIDIYNFGCLTAVPNEIVKSLNSGSFVNVANCTGNTPLHFAVGFSVQLEVIEELLKYGADIMAVNVDEDTPISITLRRSNFSSEFPVCKNIYNQNKSKEILKLFLKYSLIKSNFHDSIIDLETLHPEGFKFLHSFIHQCKSELLLMKEAIIDGFSLFQIVNSCLHLNDLSLLTNESNVKLELCIKNKFPIYSDIIIFNLKKCYTTNFSNANVCFGNK